MYTLSGKEKQVAPSLARRNLMRELIFWEDDPRGDDDDEEEEGGGW
jgi:hypothetical protein